MYTCTLFKIFDFLYFACVIFLIFPPDIFSFSHCFLLSSFSSFPVNIINPMLPHYILHYRTTLCPSLLALFTFSLLMFVSHSWWWWQRIRVRASFYYSDITTLLHSCLSSRLSFFFTLRPFLSFLFTSMLFDIEGEKEGSVPSICPWLSLCVTAQQNW